MITSRVLGLITAIVIIGGVIAYLEYGKVMPVASSPIVEVTLPPVASSTPAVSTSSKESLADRIARKSKSYERAKEITTPDGFINSGGAPISIGQYIGKKVVLLDIWTYSCINCQRTIPYLNSWYDKYEGDGFVILGLHTPEFEFEKNYDNVALAVKKFDIRFPVVLDNDYSTWNAYGNLYWPRKYLIDIDGFVTYDHIGEGGYEETEKKIQDALRERADVLGEKSKIDAPLTKDMSAKQLGILSPETYFGAMRNEYLGNGDIGVQGSHSFTMPDELVRNHFYLEGAWNIAKEYAESSDAETRIVYPYVAKEVYFVASADPSISIDVYRDGKALGTVAGEDVSEQNGVSHVTVGVSRLYKLVKEDVVSAHTLELVVRGKGLKAFTFTFGS